MYKFVYVYVFNKNIILFWYDLLFITTESRQRQQLEQTICCDKCSICTETIFFDIDFYFREFCCKF